MAGMRSFVFGSLQKVEARQESAASSGARQSEPPAHDASHGESIPEGTTFMNISDFKAVMILMECRYQCKPWYWLFRRSRGSELCWNAARHIIERQVWE